MKMTLKPRTLAEPVPYQLLLLADPDLGKIKEYLPQSQLFLAKNEANKLVGACVTQEISTNHWEILNIAVNAHQHNQGIGKQIIREVVYLAQQQHMRELWVATGNSSIGQLAFYQKCGFEMHSIVQNYFVDNYAEPIIENGIMCKHQVRLNQKL